MKPPLYGLDSLTQKYLPLLPSIFKLLIMQNYFSRPLPHLMLLVFCMLMCLLATTFVMTALDDVLASRVYWQMAIQSLVIFLLPTYLAMRLVRRHALTRLGLRHTPKIGSAIHAIVLMMTILPFVNLTAGLNAALPLPDWAIRMEEESDKFIEQILMIDNWQNFGLNLLWIALMPALCEEMFFRGFVQNTLHRYLSNVHWTIFISALIFSAFHLQFVSFLPRVFLGIVMGYLFYWSGSLWLSVLAHFANNAMAVCVYFYITYNQLPITMDDIDVAIGGKNTSMAIVSVVVSMAILGCIYYIEHKKKIDAAVEKMKEENSL
jgi:membrane protease YdiL (CAAX protease family)